MQVDLSLAMRFTLAYNPPEMAEAQRHDRSWSRPFSVTLVTWGVFIIGLANVWRAVALFQQSGLLLELGVSFDPRVRMLVALVWALIFILMFVASWRRLTVSRFLTPLLLFLYAVYEVGFSGLFAQSTVSRDGIQASVILYGIAVLFSAWALNHKSARRYFHNRRS